MFEYLMPQLVMPNFEDTLLDLTCKGAVARQISCLRRGEPGRSRLGNFRVGIQLHRRSSELPISGIWGPRLGFSGQLGR